MKHLDSETDVLNKLTDQIDAFLATATPQMIWEQMSYLHGCLDEDVPSLQCGKWNEQGQIITSCPSCSGFTLEWSALAHGARPELKDISNYQHTVCFGSTRIAMSGIRDLEGASPSMVDVVLSNCTTTIPLRSKE